MGFSASDSAGKHPPPERQRERESIHYIIHPCLLLWSNYEYIRSTSYCTRNLLGPGSITTTSGYGSQQVDCTITRTVPSVEPLRVFCVTYICHDYFLLFSFPFFFLFFFSRVKQEAATSSRFCHEASSHTHVLSDCVLLVVTRDNPK